MTVFSAALHSWFSFSAFNYIMMTVRKDADMFTATPEGITSTDTAPQRP